MENVFFSKNRIFRLGPIRAVYFALFVIFFIFTEIGRKVYRPYVYQHRIDDFGFADVVGNLLGTVAVIFFNLGFCHASRLQSIRVIALAAIGVTIYELLQPVLPRGVLDWKDAISTPIAGLLSLIIVSVVWRFIRDPLPDTEDDVDS